MTEPFKVGFRWVFSAGFSDPAREDLKRGLVAQQLAEAQVAHSAGNPTALAYAVALLRDHCPHQAWPEWVQAAVHEHVTSEQAPSGRGRQANRETQLLDDYCDFIRVRDIQAHIDVEGCSLTAACKAVAEELRGAASGGDRAMEAAYRRFYERLQAEPERYHPLINMMERADLLARMSPHIGSRKRTKIRN